MGKKVGNYKLQGDELCCIHGKYTITFYNLNFAKN